MTRIIAEVAAEAARMARQQEREAVLAGAEAHLASIGIDPATGAESDDFTIEGDALKWASVATGTANVPTRFSPNSFGSGVMRVPLLLQHASEQVLGVAEVEPSSEGLKARAKLSNTQAARDALTLVRDGGLSGFSIGWLALGLAPYDKRADGTPVRVISKAALQELSLVTFPADRAARVQAVGGQPTPKYLHCAPAYERNASAADTTNVLSRMERDRIIAQAEADAFGIVLSDKTAALADENIAFPPEEDDAFRTAPVNDGSLRAWQREDARRLRACYEANGLTSWQAAERNRRGSSKGAW